MSKEAKYFIITAHHKELSSNDNKALNDSLYTKLMQSDFNVIQVDGIYENNFEKSFLCYSYHTTNDYMSAFTVDLLNKYKQNTAIIKYENDLNPYLLNYQGKKTPMKYKPYTNEINNENYTFIKDGLVLCFEVEKVYKEITEKNQLALGMIVEYLQNDTWRRALISDVEKDWFSKWSVFAKHRKIRVQV